MVGFWIGVEAGVEVGAGPGFAGAGLGFAAADLGFAGAGLGFTGADSGFAEAGLGFTGADLGFAGAGLAFFGAALGLAGAGLDFLGVAAGFFAAGLALAGLAFFAAGLGFFLVGFFGAGSGLTTAWGMALPTMASAFSFAARACFAATARALEMAFCSFSTFLRASLAALRASLSTLGAFLWAAFARSNRRLASSALCLAAFNFSLTEVDSGSGFFAGVFLTAIFMSSFACGSGGCDGQLPRTALCESKNYT